MSIKKQIADILNIKDNDDWDIYDSRPKDNLYLVHYNRNANMKYLSWLRGVIVDIKEESVVCRSSYMKTFQYDEFIFNDNSFTMDNNESKGILDIDMTYMYVGMEGVTIRVFQHHNKIYLSTHKRIDIINSKSRWGSSIPFIDMINELPFPDVNKLYNNTENSPIVYVFIVSHPDITYVSKNLVTRGFVSFFGYHIMKKDNLSNTLNIYDFKEEKTSDLEIAKSENKLYVAEPLSTAEANNHLQHGFYKQNKNVTDKRANNGEFIICFNKISEYIPYEIFAVESTAYSWRKSIRGESSSLYNQFFMLTDHANINMQYDSLQEYKRRFPLYNVYNTESIIKKINSGDCLLEWKMDKTNDTMIYTYEGRLFNIWASFIMANPLNKQSDIVKLYDRYIEDTKFIVNTLSKLHNSSVYKNKFYSSEKKILNIIQKAIYEVDQYIDNNKIGDTEISMYNDMIYNSIEKKIIVLSGSSVYAILKYLRSYEHIIENHLH